MPRIVAVILAGGLARRIGGGDKPLRPLGPSTILGHVLARIAPQAAATALNANGDPARFAAYRLAVLPDPVPGHVGPLAGILAGLLWADVQQAPWLLTVPGDCPFLPTDLAARLHQAAAAAGAPQAVARSAGRTHPVAALWSTALRPDLCRAIQAGQRKVGAYGDPVPVDWPTAPVDPFFNVNTASDLEQAGRLLALMPACGSGPPPPGGTRTPPPG